MNNQLINEEVIKIQQRGQITLPISWRKGLGNYVKLIKDNQRIIIEPVQIVSYPVRHYTKADIDSFLIQDKADE